MNTLPSEADTLDNVLHSGSISVTQAQRLKVIRCFFFRGCGRSQTHREVGVSLVFVDRWRQRWQHNAAERARWFSCANQEHRSARADRDFLLSIVADAPRSGKPAKFDEATKNRIIAIALTKPSELGVPIEKWSHQLLADYLMEQGIVDTISSTTVGDFLKSAPRKSTQE